jgi:hypothetical protein
VVRLRGFGRVARFGRRLGVGGRRPGRRHGRMRA